MPTASRSRAWRHPGLALLLPAFLIALGAWQVTRVAGTAEDFTRRAGRVQASIERMQPLAVRDPGAVVRFTNDPQSYTAAQALELMQGAQSDMRRDAAIEQARQAAAWATVAGGGVALLAVLGCLAAASLGAWRGRRSRDALVGAFRVVVRLLPPLLGLVAVATAVSVIGAVLFEAGGVWFQDTISAGELKLILAGVVVAGGGVLLAFNAVRQLRRVLQAFTPDPLRVLGRAVGPDAGPGLFAFIRQVAAGQGAAAPDNVVLGMTEGFFVTSSPILLLPEQRVLSGRSLYLPAPFLPLLNRGEVAAIVAHELAHFTGDDTAYSLHFVPLYAGMARSMDAVSSRTSVQGWIGAAFQPAAILARHVMDTFSRTVAHWSRLRELEADRAALKHESGQTVASALVRTGIGAGLIGGAVREMYDRPDQADVDLVGAVLARAGSLGFTDPARHLEDRQPHPTDSHPPTRQRIAALGIAVDDALLALASRPLQAEDAAFTEDLFADWTGLRRMLGEDLLAAAKAHDRNVQARLRAAADAVTADIPIHERTRLAAVTLAVCGGLLALGGLALAWVAWGTGWVSSDDAQIVLLTGVVVGLMGAGLIAMGRYRHRRGQAGPFLVLGPAGFRCLGIPQQVPWSAVDGIQVTTGQVFLTTFRLNATQPLPEQAGYKAYIKLNRRKRLLTLKGFVPLGMTAQAYLNLLNSALRAHRAAALLREREAAGLGGAQTTGATPSGSSR